MKKLSRELQHIIERKKREKSEKKKIIAFTPRNGENRNEKNKTTEYVGSHVGDWRVETVSSRARSHLA